MSINPLAAAPKIGILAAAALAASLGTAGTAGATSNVPAPVRAALSASASASVANNTLTITGTDNADSITLTVAGADPTTLDVALGPNVTQSFPLSTFNSIGVTLGAGDDTFNVRTPSLAVPMTLDAGSGNDTITTGAGNDVVLGGSGNDNIKSGAGDDSVDAGSGNDTVTGGSGHDSAFLDGGQDSFVWNPGDGSDFVNGGTGTDTLVFNGSNANEVMSLSADGQQSVFLRDVAGIRMDMNSVEALDLNTLNGADSFTVNDMTGTGFRDATVNFGNDGLQDKVTVNGTENADHVRVVANNGGVDVRGLAATTHITGNNPTDLLQVNTLGGNDKVNVNGDVFGLVDPGVDLGAGQL